MRQHGERRRPPLVPGAGDRRRRLREPAGSADRQLRRCLVTFYAVGRNEFAAAPATPGNTPQVAPGTYWLMISIETMTNMQMDASGTMGSAQKQFPFTVGSAVPNPAAAATPYISPGLLNALYILGTPP